MKFEVIDLRRPTRMVFVFAATTSTVFVLFSVPSSNPEEPKR